MENITQKTKSSQQEKSVEYVDLPKIYQKKPFANLNRRFLTIWAITLAFNVIIVTILAHKHFEITSEYVRKVQEHYANFLYDKIEQSMSKLEETGEGMAAKETKAKKITSQQNKGSGESGKSEGKSRTGGSKARATTPGERVATHSRTTAEIASTVSNKGILALLTGTGEAAQGDGVVDILGDGSTSTGSENLEQVLASLDGIKSSGTPAKSGKSAGGGGIRGGRAKGGSSNIADIITDLSRAETKRIGTKTEKMVVSQSKVKAEAGKSAGRNAEDVLQVVNSHRAAIEYCYQRQLRSTPNLRGKVSIRFVIRPDGSIKDVKIIASTLNNPSVERCIINKIRRWRDFGAIDPSKGDAVFRQDYVFGY
ncbi:hypothetical protein B5M50_00580 [candidate division KSB1 bacterium 4484_219]|nr:MAG: hypothetical protein B5M50_00580 [candidate division KSB1 bacterium 4484_219]